MPVTEEHNEHLKTLHLSGEAERGQDGDVSDGAVVDGNGESAATAGDAADGAADGADGAAVGANNEEGAFKEKLKKLDSSSSDEFDFSTNEFQRDLRDSSSEGPEFPGNEQDNTSAGARDAGEINIGHAAQNASLKDTTAPLHTVNGEGCGTGKGRADCSGGLRMTQRPPLRSIDSIHSPSSSPSPSQNSVPKFSNSYLKPNAKFVGDQVSDKSIYYVEVQFKTVDLVNSLVTGFLQITGLTDSPSHITTYFKEKS